MLDTEVLRLRRLRDSALRVRAVARSLSKSGVLAGHAMLEQTACAGWRVARTVSGHLRAHPYEAYQRDATAAAVLANSAVAAMTALTAVDSSHALQAFGSRLRLLLRAVDDARALTLVPHLSDAFGRAQIELRALLTRIDVAGAVAPVRARQPGRKTLRHPAAQNVQWPYVTL